MIKSLGKIPESVKNEKVYKAKTVLRVKAAIQFKKKIKL